MANIVTINNTSYLVDVGYGADTAPIPVPLVHDQEFVTVAPARGRLQYRSLEEHTDSNQRVWVYSTQEKQDSPWKDQYCFTEIEFIPADFEVMNFRTSVAPQSYFVQTIMCVRTILDETKEKVVGRMILHKDYVKRRTGEQAEIVETLENEEQRVKALEKYFDVVLSLREQRAIRGLMSELK